MSKKQQIPRVIHYCWFGRGEKPKKIVKCMNSWTKQLSQYQYMEWNEDNFDINLIPYVKQAYESKKYAFVSDYVRLYALYHHGGIYLDTDVEVIRPLDPLLFHEAFSGFEDEINLQSGTMGARKEHPWIKELLSYYDNKNFILHDGKLDTTTNTSIITRICIAKGLITNGKYQVLGNGVTFYPREFFSPYDYINGGIYRSEDSYSIHHFAQSWLPLHVRLRGELKRVISRYAGPKFISDMRAIFWNRNG